MHRYLALPLLCAGLALAPASTAFAEQVSFDEYPPSNDPGQVLEDEYADLGLHFVQAGSIWGGVSAGDPGGWGLEGTMGPAFMGFPGPYYNLVMYFDWPVSSLRFDMARAREGSSASMRVFGYRGGQVVEQLTVPFSDAAGEWTTVELTQDVDVVVGLSSQSGPYGVDRMTWSGPLADQQQEIPVAIDLLPDSEDNPIRMGRRGMVPVVLHGSEGFDVESVDPETLGFGPGDAPLAHRSGPHAVDHDEDGWLDWELHFRLEAMQLDAGSAEACLVGEIHEGDLVVGCDLFTPVGRR